jgi:hypothetical protein
MSVMTMTATVTAGETFSMYLTGSGTATVDWGDGNSENVTLREYVEDEDEEEDEEYLIPHTYAASGSRTIKITGAMVAGLDCYDNQLTALDVSKNTALTMLGCGKNPLTALDVSKNTKLEHLNCIFNNLNTLDVSKNTELVRLWCEGNNLNNLDVSKNTALTSLECYYNQLNAAALDALFGTLHSNTGYKYIGISGNPGTSGCNKAIAEQRGWTVSD